MKNKSSPKIFRSSPKVTTAVYSWKWMFSKQPKKSTSIWATFVSTSVANNFQISPRLVTLDLPTTSKMSSSNSCVGWKLWHLVQRSHHNRIGMEVSMSAPIRKRVNQQTKKKCLTECCFYYYCLGWCSTQRTLTLLCKGKYRCTADLLLAWFIFNQTSKDFANSTESSWIQTKNRRSAIQRYFPLP